MRSRPLSFSAALLLGGTVFQAASEARAALPVPTAAQCHDPAYTRTAAGRAHAAIADAGWRNAACLQICQAATVTRTQCLGESFYGSLCGHIEAAKHIEARTSRNAQTWLRANTKCGARLLDEGYANRPVVRGTATVLGPDGETPVANVARLGYTRPHATVASQTHTLEAAVARLAVQGGLPQGSGAASQDPVLARHLRWQSENDAGDHVIESCEEYAWARTHTVSQLEDQFALRSQSALAQAGVLYESAGGVAKPWAFGLKASANPAGEPVRDAAGVVYRSPADGVTTYRTSMFFGVTRPKNGLVGLPVRADQPSIIGVAGAAAPLVPAVLTTGQQGMYAPRTVSIHAVGLADDGLLAEMLAVRGATHGDTAAENKAFYDRAFASPVLADRQLATARLKDAIAAQMAERAHVVATLQSDLLAVYADALNLLGNAADGAEQIVLADAVPVRDPLAAIWNPLGEQIQRGAWAVNPDGLSQPTLRSGHTTLFDDPEMLNPTAVAMAQDDARYAPIVAAAARRLLALDGAIEANLQSAREAGCFRVDAGAARYTNACDWDAVSFVSDLRARYRFDRNGDYLQCVSALGPGVFAQVDAAEEWHPTAGTPLASFSAQGFEYRSLLERADGTCAYRNDVATLDADALVETGTEGLGDTCYGLDGLLEAGYANQPSTLRRYMLCAEALDRQIDAAAEAAVTCGRASRDSLEAAGMGFDAEEGRVFQRGGGTDGAFGQSLDEGNDLFRVRYDLVNAWGIEGFVDGADVDPTDNTACGLTPHMDNTFSIRASALGFDYDVMRAQTSVATGGSRDARTVTARANDLFIMNQQIAVPPSATTTAAAFNVIQDRSPPTEGTIFDVSTTFVVGFVPVTVTGGIAGRLGLEYRVGGGHEGGCEHGSLRVQNQLTPSAGVDAFAEASVNLLVVSAGIKGSLELLGLSLPMGGGIEAEATSLAIDNRVEQILTALKGYLAAFVSITFPLLPEARYEMPLFSWEGVRDAQVLHADVDDALSIVGLRALARDAQ